ncbi:hypothetical protein ACFOEE_03690 [Pseudoalteromonas fenneropenaei]|uniref:LruC domain-containing protein n=1 Tax=Pseudoalteromonas fenneropenaei TaxID=1737459 RepID=A0ABV7CGC1_9GAMM
MKFVTALVLLSSLLFLSACQLKDSEPEKNLTITKVDTGPLLNLEQQANFTVFYDLNIIGFDNIEVDVHFYLIHQDELQDTSNATEQTIDAAYQLGVTTLSQLTQGQHTLSLDVELPDNLAGGEYRIVAQLDPLNNHTEDNEDDNPPNLDHQHFAKGDYPYANIHIAPISAHDYQLLAMTFGQNALLLDAPHIDLGTSHLHSDLVGYLTADYHGNNSDVVTVTAEAQVNSNWHPLHFWSKDHSRFVDAFSYQFNAENHEQHIAFDIAFSDELTALLYQEYQTLNQLGAPLAVRFRIAQSDLSSDHNPANDELLASIPLYFFNDTAERTSAGKIANIKLSQSFAKSYGDQSKFSVGVDLSGQLLIVPDSDPGARITAEGSVDAYFFNAKNTLFGISYDGSAYVSGTNTGYSSEMTIFNNVVFEDESYTTKYEKSWTKSWEEEKVLAKATFSVGPIPMSVQAGVDGSLGFELTVGYNAELYAGGDLFSVDFGAFGRGGVDLAIASAGVQADFNLIDNVFNMDSSAGFALVSNDNPTPHIYYALALTDDIDVISGKFGLYAETSGIKWCSKWGIPYPCGTKTTRYDLWLYQTPSVYQKSWTLLDKEGTVNL